MSYTTQWKKAMWAYHRESCEAGFLCVPRVIVGPVVSAVAELADFPPRATHQST
jgi:hypothetical protein